MAGVYEHHSYDVLRKLSGIEASVSAAQRMPDENIGSGDGGSAKQKPEILYCRPTCPKLRCGLWIGVARSTPGAIIRTHSGDLSDRRLDSLPYR
jgi:hypothetical protein